MTEPPPQHPMQREFLKARIDEPDLDYSTFYTRRAARRAAGGFALNSLGKNLKSGPVDDLRDVARSKANNFMAFGKLTPASTVVDFGCGSLRIGVHFIDMLEPGGYWGLDVIPDFFEMGKEMLGAEYIAQKRPHLEQITPGAIDRCIAAQPDFVFLYAVVVHLHPDLIDEVFATLQRLLHKPGARLTFNASFATRPLRLRGSSWAWPRESFAERLPELALVETGRIRMLDLKDVDEPIGNTTFVFERRG